MAAQSLVGAQKLAHTMGHVVQRRLFTLHHVRVKFGRPTYGLAGIIDDEIQPGTRREHLPAERLDARRVTHIEPEDLESMSPLAEVGFLRIALSGVAGETSGNNHLGAGA